MSIDLPPPAALDRTVLRTRLRAAREAFVAGPQAEAAAAALSGHLVTVLAQLEPRCLGLYWPIRSEFNAVAACALDPGLKALPWALPYTHRPERRMDYRAWDGERPTLRDECGLPTAAGAPAEPDVVLLPCVGYTDTGHRLGYGAGYFDRWLAAHPGVTAVGVAWSVGHIPPGEFIPEDHDLPMVAVVTDRGIIG
jgi:5-formyltetrahydrofolate cyclo-ligase